jgi:hypothetical protein
MRNLAATLLWVFLSSGSAQAQQVEPIAIQIEMSDVQSGGGHSYYWEYTCWDSRICTAEYHGGPYIPRENDLEKLEAFVKNSITAQYGSKGSSAGYYLGDAHPDYTLQQFEGIRFMAILPSEVFRDSSSEWDQFEVVAAIGSAGSEDAQASGTLWLLPMNYRRRARGGISFGPEPSPDWAYSSLQDFDATNGRLRSIQTGIQHQIELAYAKAKVDGEKEKGRR